MWYIVLIIVSEMVGRERKGSGVKGREGVRE